MDVAVAAQERRECGEHRQAGGDAEHDDEAVVEGRRDQAREELGPGEDVLVGGGERRQRAGRSEQVGHRVLAEHRREHRGNGWEARDVLSDGMGHALLLQPAQ